MTIQVDGGTGTTLAGFMRTERSPPEYRVFTHAIFLDPGFSCQDVAISGAGQKLASPDIRSAALSNPAHPLVTIDFECAFGLFIGLPDGARVQKTSVGLLPEISSRQRGPCRRIRFAERGSLVNRITA